MALKFARKKLPFANYVYIALGESFSLVLINGYLPLFVFYTEKRIPHRAVACTSFLWVKIRPRFKHDLSIITHEVTHIRQINRSFFMHYFLYNFSVKYRYKSELQAYANQCLHMIVHSHIGINYVLVEELIEWVSVILSENMNFSSYLLKEKKDVKRDFTKVLVSVIKDNRDLIKASTMKK